MSVFVKKLGGIEYYRIDDHRAAGIIPYFISNGKVFIMINTEYKNDELLHNIIGGKVDKNDNLISDTMIREFNEETGFLLFDKIKLLREKLLKETILLEKPKYMISLLKVELDNCWKNLPDLYSKMYKNENIFLDRESEKIKWINLFEFNEECTYLLTLALYKLKKYFFKFDIDQNNLFVD